MLPAFDPAATCTRYDNTAIAAASPLAWLVSAQGVKARRRQVHDSCPHYYASH